MLPRFILAAVFTLGASTAAFANCHCAPQTGYSVSEERGVTVLRGNIPKMSNPQRAIIADRKAAEQRADRAERRARMAQREAREARAALTARPINIRINNGFDRRRSSPYFSGNFGFGASVSGPRFKGRGRGFGGRRTISKPIFSRGIRS